MIKTLTSHTHPIRVDFLPLTEAALPGRVGMTFAPGKQGPGVTGHWQRDLTTDLWRLRQTYHVEVLVSLIEVHEAKALNIGGLVPTSKDVGLEVVEMPMRDVHAPESLPEITVLVTFILHAARQNRNVAIFCRGGLGRTGVVAACCLVRLGVEAAVAVSAVRQVRPGTIETAAQEDFVGRFAKLVQGPTYIPLVQPSRASQPKLSSFRGCLLGGALGDALGYPLEFVKPMSAIRAKFGDTAPQRIAPPGKHAVVSDDTQMTLFTAEGLIRTAQRVNDRGLASYLDLALMALKRWYTTQVNVPKPEPDCVSTGWLITNPRLHARRAPGTTCLRELEAHVSDPKRGRRVDNTSKGCGAVMRSAPFGLVASSRREAFSMARDAALLTHGHPSGYLSAAYFAAVLFDVTRGKSLSKAMTHADNLLKREPGHEELAKVVETVCGLSASAPRTAHTIEMIGGGWTGEEALGIALFCALGAHANSSQGIMDALWLSVAHSGDSDSTGSITGNLLGAIVGVEQLPKLWLEGLELGDVVDRVACDLYAATILGSRLDDESYPPN